MVEKIEKICPHCGGNMFMAAITRAGIVTVTADEKGENVYEITREAKDKADIVVGKCARCRAGVTGDELVTGVKCSKCGSQVNSSDVNQEGVCSVCVAIEERNELANASKEDLIRMLIEAEKKLNPTVATVQKKIDTAMNAPEPAQDAPEEEPEQTPAPRKRAVKRNTKAAAKIADETSEDDTEDTPEPASETEDVALPAPDVQEDVDAIANQQEAPFPDVPVESNNLADILPGFADAPPDNNETGKFQMFDDSDERI